MQERVLVRARGLAAFRQALCGLAQEGGPASVRRRLVLVPTRAAAELLRQTIEQRWFDADVRAVVLPEFVTRADWLRRLHESLPEQPPMLTRVEREVLLQRAAEDACRLRRIARAPFRLRPGLIATMLDFYDELRRRQRTVRRFAGALFADLRVERGTDRGSESLIAQTSFLGSAFLAYERGVAASGGVDEHALRDRLLATQPPLAFDDLIVAVADHPADPSGLWPADFDLAGRLDGLRRVVVAMTDEAHDAGFRDRVERELPGIEEAWAPDRPRGPVLVVPAGAADALAFVSRDREEELRDIARDIRRRALAAGDAPPAPVAIIVNRPLPYLYLAQRVLLDARVPYQTFDALPLAAEPYSALLDLVMAVARTGGTREAAVSLLRSTLVRIEVAGTRVGRREVSALDAVLALRRTTGEAATYPAEVEAAARSVAGRRLDVARARRAAVAAAAVAAELRPYRAGLAASEQVASLERFLRAHERRPVAPPGEGEAANQVDRYQRARAAVLTVLAELIEAFGRHDDRQRPHDELTAAIHHAIEQRTFMPRRGHQGVHLVDRSSARFGEFLEAYLVGLVDTDWSDRPRRSVFYSSGLLKSLGWPQDTDQALAQQAAVRDVLALAGDRTRLSAFQLDGDAAVSLSPLIELARSMPTVEEALPARGDVFPDETLPVLGKHPVPSEASWLALRRARPDIGVGAYGGFIDPRAPEVYRVSRVDRYVTCPFKYFAEYVLRLPEERRDVSGLTPLEQGTLLHALFERFYKEWQANGRAAIDSASLPDALAAFARVVADALADVPEPDRTLERMRLLGSMVTRGVAERVFELEVTAGVGVRERLLEYDLVGAFEFPVRHGLLARAIEIHGKADRIDVLADGTLRVVDYKLGRMPDLEASVQAAVYAHCARQRLETRDGQPHPVSWAGYLAFGDDRRLEGRVGSGGQPVAEVVETRASAFAGLVERIEAGAFPPQPIRTSECQWCGYSGVCRKEYRVEDDETADAV
jgi:RecB family exonuclease